MEAGIIKKKNKKYFTPFDKPLGDGSNMVSESGMFDDSLLLYHLVPNKYKSIILKYGLLSPYAINKMKLTKFKKDLINTYHNRLVSMFKKDKLNFDDFINLVKKEHPKLQDKAIYFLLNNYENINNVFDDNFKENITVTLDYNKLKRDWSYYIYFENHIRKIKLEDVKVWMNKEYTKNIKKIKDTKKSFKYVPLLVILNKQGIIPRRMLSIKQEEKIKKQNKLYNMLIGI